jgi:hypothetical protein
MSMISLPKYVRPADRFVRLVRAGLMAALVVALYVALSPFEASRDCRVGLFSAGFETGFNGRLCTIILKRFGQDLLKIPLPRDW